MPSSIVESWPKTEKRSILDPSLPSKIVVVAVAVVLDLLAALAGAAPSVGNEMIDYVSDGVARYK